MATSLVAVIVGGLVQLTAFAARATLEAGRTSFAVVVAQQKMEELLPEAGLGLSLSPAAALNSNLDGFFDFVDRHGRQTGSGATPPPSTDYVRRWSVRSVPDADTLIVEVQVTDIRNAASAAAAHGHQVHIVAAKAGKAL